MPATAAQALANRENARKSTGPRTEEGRKRSSLNACRHNLTGGPALSPKEDPAAYQAHLEKYEDDYGPDSETEQFIVRQIADAAWRLNRLARMEDDLMAMSANPFAEENDNLLLRLERLQRYRKSIEATFLRYRKEWREVLHRASEDLKDEQRIADVKYKISFANFLRVPETPSPSPDHRAEPATENRRL
jgi:hypothetical protein